MSLSRVAQPGRRQRRCPLWDLGGAAQLCFGGVSGVGVVTTVMVIVVVEAAILYHSSFGEVQSGPGDSSCSGE